MSSQFLWQEKPIPFHPGESIASALGRSGILALGHSLGDVPRQVFCGMGQCQNCLVRVQGVTVEACLTPCQEGLRVEPDASFSGDRA